ncbi:DUF5050 domain-containing protein [Butyrivibrio sp. YAB3001]|uniref:DUF5050 domain-containing protein n=1 Tax=Butyrivibrio sp. YAB3001 TaxID=1520812 RepID=UPI00158811F0|nr:DUF5050 domain-containing protein [Butyrivibrio sp. YAB3001]
MSDSATGNTAGNLHNGGLLFEMNGKVYFANPSDNDCLYSMNVDETNVKRITNMSTKLISGANGYLFFYMDSSKKSSNLTGLGGATNQHGIYRCKVNGDKLTCLLREYVDMLQLCGKYIYYQDKEKDGFLGKIRIDKSNKKVVLDELVSPACYDDGFIYYTGVKSDHGIHRLSTATDGVSDFLPGSYFYPVVTDGYIYYMNGEDNYSICRTNIRSGDTETVTKDRVDSFTMNSQYIYYAYSNGNQSALKRCNVDGSNQIVIYEAITNSLHLTSQYLYFKIYGNDDVFYHVPINNSDAVSVCTF